MAERVVDGARERERLSLTAATGVAQPVVVNVKIPSLAQAAQDGQGADSGKDDTERSNHGHGGERQRSDPRRGKSTGASGYDVALSVDDGEALGEPDTISLGSDDESASDAEPVGNPLDALARGRKNMLKVNSKLAQKRASISNANELESPENKQFL